MALDGHRWEFINETALWLHGQTERSAIQHGILERLSGGIPHRMSLFDLCRMEEGRIEYFDPVSATMPADAIERYYRRYAPQDYTTWSFTPEQATVYRDLDLVDAAIRDTTPIYREWMEPLDLYFGMGCTIVMEGVLFGSVTLFRSREEGDFSEDDVRVITEIGRHLGVRFHTLWPQGLARTEQRDAILDLAERSNITGRELEVMRAMVAGRTNREIAGALFISESTVKKHVNAVYRKLGIANRMELVQLIGSIARGDTAPRA